MSTNCYYYDEYLLDKAVFIEHLGYIKFPNDYEDFTLHCYEQERILNDF